MNGKMQIGSITAGYRPIKSGREYEKYFPKPGNEDRIILQDGEVEDTVELMKKVVWKYIDDTKEIAKNLQSISQRQTCQNIWDFLYHHIQYKLDERGLEQLRRPARSWVERETGIDCDCFSIFCSSILTNLKIPHKFRITKYDSPNYQHVYVVVPDAKGEIIIDPVLSRFDFEKPYTNKKDFTMNLSGIDVAVLSGISNDIEDVLLGFDLGENLGSASQEEQLQAIYKYLVSTRNSIAQNPALVIHSEDPQAFLKMLDYAIVYWNTDKRAEALSILARNEIDLNDKVGISGSEQLGGGKQFFQKLSETAKTVGQKAGAALKTAAKAVVKYNPISVAARGGLLLAMKLNIKKMASKLKWAYGTKEQAQKAGISLTQYNNAKKALQKIESLYADKIQGDKNALKDAILKGRAGGLNGFVQPLGELGEPITMTAAIAAATPLIIAAVKIMKDSGLFDKNEDTSTDNLLEEAKAANNSAKAPTANQATAQSLKVANTGSNNTSSNSAANQLPAQESAQSYSDPVYAELIIPEISPSTGGSTGSFLKDNPMVAVVGLGAVGLITYYLLKPSEKPRKSLSGFSKEKSKPRKQNSPKQKAKGQKIQRVTIK